MTPAEAAPPRRPFWGLRLLDLLVLAFGVVATAYLAWRRPSAEAMELVDGRLQQIAVLGGIFVLCLLLLAFAQRRGWIRGASRTIAYLMIGLLLLMLPARLRKARVIDNFPVIPLSSKAFRHAHMRPRERARWGALVAAHRLATTIPVDSTMRLRPETATIPPITIPWSWSFPDDIELAVERGAGDTTWIWSRDGTGATDCSSIPARHRAPLCDSTRSASPELAYARPARVQFRTPDDPRDVVGAPWTQYRADAAKHGASAIPASIAAAPTATWRWVSGEPVRASASVVGDLVLIGSHGSGDINAVDLFTGRPRWRSRVPNWIHQDIVSDGRVAVVGFGDNYSSFQGRAPSGVSAFSLSTGRHLWTRFDESSVMTSPLIYGATIVYATHTGAVNQRSLATGDLMASEQLPNGGATMGPPALIGDTAIFTIDMRRVCAMQLRTFSLRWCRELPGERLTGHSAAAVGNGLVITSGPVGLRRVTLQEARRMPVGALVALLWSNIRMPPRLVGQQMTALDLHTGAIRWRSRIFPATRDVPGHTSGTATLTDSLGVIVLPYADTLASFRVRDGTVLWTAGAHGARGSPLIVDDHVVVAGRDGVVELRELFRGSLKCEMERTVGYDRAGPALAGDRLIFADLNGMLEVVSLSHLLACDRVQLRSESSATTVDTGHINH